MKRARCKICRALTNYPPLCKKHSKDVFGVVVAPSNIPGGGLGLFATKYFQRGDAIAPLYGEAITADELTRRYGSNTAPYAVAVGHRIVDGARVRYIGHMSNSSFGHDDHSDQDMCNADIQSDKLDRPWIRATKPIQRGEEILTYYGRNYKLERKCHETKTLL